MIDSSLNNKPLVTVLMPCYNAMPYLPMALNSIINQTYKNLEILCINDGSTDETDEILEEYAKKDSRIRVVHNETNIKLIRTLNKGIELATGEYIARMDADDISSPDRIETQMHILLSRNIDLVGTNIKVTNEKETSLKTSVLRQHSRLACFFASLFYVPVHHATIVARKNVFDKFKFKEKDYVIHTEDYELFSRMLLHEVNVVNIDNTLYTVRINQQSVSRTYTDEQDNNFLSCVKENIFDVFKKTIDDNIVQIIANRISKNISPKNFSKGIKEIKWIKQQFESIHKFQLNKSDKKEIYVIYKTHLFDICIQTIKKTNIIVKANALFTLLKHFDMFFNKTVWKYILSKL
jgi:glycosyltransferase involved in cell wall biosynthesis